MSMNNNTEASQKFPMMPVAPLGVIAMRGCEEMGKAVNAYLTQWQVDNSTDELLHSFYGSEANGFLIRTNCPRFGTGEGKGMLLDSVRGYDLYIICDVGAYQCTYKMYGKEIPMTPDEHYADLKRLIAAASGKAKRINVIMPMLYEGRQHRRTARESMDCALMLQELVGMGVANIITFDAHDPRVQNAIPLSGFDNVRSSYQMIKALIREYPDVDFDPEKIMIVSPDEGGMAKCMYYSSMLGIQLGMFYKRRNYSIIVNGKNPIEAHEYLGRDLQGMDVIIADDMIASGDSMLDIAKFMHEKNAGKFFAVATYGLFTNGLAKFDKAYEDGLIHGVFCTNLTYRTPELLERPWFHEVDCSKYIAYVITAMNHDISITEMLDPAQKIKALMEKHGK